MNNDHIADELLQRYADGDLSSSHAAGVAEHMKACAQCQGAHDKLVALHGMFALAAEESARGVDFEALYSRIERGTREAPSASMLERLSVWWRDLLEQRPERVFLPATAGALAVIAVLFVSTPAPMPEETVAAVQEAAPAEPIAQPAAKTEPALALASAGSEVVQVDFGDGTGTVYEIALADGTSTPVVWINDEE